MTAPLRIADATDAAGGARQAFHAVAASVYATEPVGTAPVAVSVERSLARASFVDRQRVLVATRGSDAVGRVVARMSPALRDGQGLPLGMLGFFEAVPDPQVSRALFTEATAWLRARGAGVIVGPMDGDTWHRYRVNVGPWDDPPFPLEPWNPRYYRTLWEESCTPIESYSSKWMDDVGLLLPGLARGVERAQDRGVRIRGLDPARVRDEFGIVHELSSRIFADAFLYSALTRDEFLALYSGVERFLDPRLVLFAESPDGEPVGFVFGYGDPARPAVHYKTIGVLAEWRRAAVAALLSHHVYSNAVAMGRPQGNHALMRNDNRSQALDQGEGRVFRNYILYEWPGS